MLTDMLTSIKAHLYDRAASPLMGSIVVSWTLWNYKLPLLLLSNEPILEKYRIISEVLYANDKNIYIYGLACPLITSFLYIFIYPYPAKFVFRFTQTQQRVMSNLKREIEGEALLTVKESRELRNQLYSLEDTFQKDLVQKDTEIEQLKAEVDRLLTELRENVIPIKENKDEKNQEANTITESQIKLLELLEEKSIMERNIISQVDHGRTVGEIKYDLGELDLHGYIITHEDLQGHNTYTITHKGRSYLMKTKSDRAKNTLKTISNVDN